MTLTAAPDLPQPNDEQPKHNRRQSRSPAKPPNAPSLKTGHLVLRCPPEGQQRHGLPMGLNDQMFRLSWQSNSLGSYGFPLWLQPFWRRLSAPGSNTTSTTTLRREKYGIHARVERN